MRRSIREHPGDVEELAAALIAEANRLRAGLWKRDAGGRFSGKR